MHGFLIRVNMLCSSFGKKVYLSLTDNDGLLKCVVVKLPLENQVISKFFVVDLVNHDP